MYMKKILIGVVILLVIVMVISATYKAVNAPAKIEQGVPLPADTQIPLGKMVTGSNLETFSGTIEAVDTGCFADATCSVTVDGKKIILVTGGRGMDPNAPVGKLIGVPSIGDLEAKIGSHANVYAGMTETGDYTLYGNDKYYVEVTSSEIKR